MDAGSFVDYILESPRLAAANPSKSGSAPRVLTELLRRAGLREGISSNAVIDDDMLSSIDRGFANLLPATAAVDAAIALDLTLASQ